MCVRTQGLAPEIILCLHLSAGVVARSIGTIVTSCALCRWLLRRIEGVLILEHNRMEEEEEPYSELPDEANRDQQIVLTTLPLLSGLLSREAGLHLDLNWGTFALQTLAWCLLMGSNVTYKPTRPLQLAMYGIRWAHSVQGMHRPG